MFGHRRRPTMCLLAGALALLAVLWPVPASAAITNDPLVNTQWSLTRIRAAEAWKVSQGEGINIAVIDTGVNYRHEDLAGKIGRQFDSLNDDFDAIDLSGHGTAVAGVAAATANNKKGIAGVAPKARIMPVRAFSSVASAGANQTDVADSIRWAADNGAHVINLSLGADIPVGAFEQDLAILYAVSKGALVVAAAGNSSSPYCGTPAFNPLALCVGASDAVDKLADFSSYGLRLDVVAPGTSIMTTNFAHGSSYLAANGTSFATPIVAGIGALLMSMGASNILAGLIIRATSRDIGLPGYDLTFGFGRVDAKAAVDLCAQIC